MLRIYKTYALPVIDYANTLYNGASEESLLSLQSIQNRCLKYCLKLPILSTTDYVHQESNVPMVNERRMYHAKILGHKKTKLPKYCATNVYQEAVSPHVRKIIHIRSSNAEHIRRKSYNIFFVFQIGGRVVAVYFSSHIRKSPNTYGIPHIGVRMCPKSPDSSCYIYVVQTTFRGTPRESRM